MMIAILGASTFSVVIILSILLICGLPLGELTMGGQYKIFPKKLRIVLVLQLALQIFFVVIILQMRGIIPLWFSKNVTKIICIVMAVYLSLNTVMNCISRSKKEKFIMTPLSLISAIYKDSTSILPIRDFVLFGEIVSLYHQMNGGIRMNQLVTGKFIALKRKQKNLTQEQLAEKLGVSNKTISKWETGKCMPDYSIVKSLCEELDVTIAELMDGEMSEEKSVRTYDDEQILDLLRRTQELEKQKNVMHGVLLIVMGIALQALSYGISGSNVKDFISGLLLGLSIAEMLVGVYVVENQCQEDNSQIVGLTTI